MRTLKKSLALVLALVMVLGLGVIGASADFTDVTSETKYAEAITVLTEIGVIDGVTDTTFNPDGTLTREQAAKIVAFVKLGPTNAKLISEAAGSPFDDVDAKRWSAGYIEYCSNLKIVEGVSEDEFNPSGKLTTAAFTKMLLVAVGYDPDENGLNGSSWAINTATLAIKAKVTDNDITISNTREITRGEACQLALKALFVGDKTVYSTVTKYVLTVTSENEKLVALSGNYYNTFDGAKKAVTDVDKDAIYGRDYTVVSMAITSETVEGSLGDSIFDLSKDSGSADAFGRPGVSYAVDGESIYFTAATPVLSYTTPVYGKAIYSALGLNKKIETLTVKTDGQDNVNGREVNASSESVFGGNGTVTEVYKTDNLEYTIVEINTYFDTVKSVKTTTDATTGVKTTTLTLNGGMTTTKLVDFAKKDAVIYTKAGATIMSMAKAETISGSLTRATNNGQYTIGGTVYQIGATSTLKSADVVGSNNANMGKTVAYYVDGMGYLMAAVDTTSAATAGTYIKVLAAEKPTTSANWMNPTGDYTGKVYGILSDGTYGEYTVNYGKTGLTDDEVAKMKDVVYEYELNSAGQLVLDTAGTVKASTAAISSGFTSIAYSGGSAILNSNTVFVFYTQETNSATIKSLSVKKGNANSGVIAAGATVVAEKGVALVVYVGGEFSSGTEAVDLAYVDASTKTTTTEVGVVNGQTVTTTVYSYKAYTADGEELTLTSKTLNLAADEGETTHDGVYRYNTDNTIGSAASESSLVKGTIKLYGSTIGVTPAAGSEAFYGYNTDMVCFLGDDTALAEGQTVVAVKNTAGNALTHVWVIKDAPEA